MTNYSITITSDIICPWCYIGHVRLSRAIKTHQQTFPQDTFVLKYLPFYLSEIPAKQKTAFPVESEPRRQRYAKKFGSRATQIEEYLVETAKGDGLEFSWGGRTGPSRNGHRLVHYAQRKGGEDLQDKVMKGLWVREFEREGDVTTLETLVEVGLEAGLGPEEEIKEYLVSGEDGDEVDRLAMEAKEKGITGVPNYEIQNVWQVSGAQDPAVFLQLFARWKDREDMQKRKEEFKVVNTSSRDGCL